MMIRKKIICFFCFLFLTPLPALSDSIQTIKEAAPARWYAEIQTKEGNTVTVDAPVHIPDVDTIPLLLVSEAPFIYELAGDESFLHGKADVRRREEILDPDRFSEIGYPPEDLLDFMQETLSSHGVTDIESLCIRAMVKACEELFNRLSGMLKTRTKQRTEDM